VLYEILASDGKAGSNPALRSGLIWLGIRWKPKLDRSAYMKGILFILSLVGFVVRECSL
jgi:hypothetical protein